jgi:hypothetical protein
VVSNTQDRHSECLHWVLEHPEKLSECFKFGPNAKKHALRVLTWVLEHPEKLSECLPWVLKHPGQALRVRISVVRRLHILGSSDYITALPRRRRPACAAADRWASAEVAAIRAGTGFKDLATDLLRSRWTIPAAWAGASTSQICRVIPTAWAGSSCPLLRKTGIEIGIGIDLRSPRRERSCPRPVRGGA